MRSLVAKALSTFGRHYPLYSGCSTLANSLPFRWALKDQPDPLWIRLKIGPALKVPTNDWLGRTLYYFGDIDPKISWICKHLVGPGDTVLDIGANVGAVSMILAQLVGETGKIHAFEPQLRLANLFQQTLEHNHVSNVFLHNLALGAQQALLDMYIHPTNSGAASLTRKYEGVEEKISVPVVNTTDYLSQLNLPSIRFVKIDVEGYEYEVIQGAFEYFMTNPPEAILFELNDHSVSFASQPVIRLFSDLGYRFFNIMKSKWHMRLYRIKSPEHERHYGHDILAAPAGEIYEDIARCVNAI